MDLKIQLRDFNHPLQIFHAFFSCFCSNQFLHPEYSLATLLSGKKIALLFIFGLIFLNSILAFLVDHSDWWKDKISTGVKQHSILFLSVIICSHLSRSLPCPSFSRKQNKHITQDSGYSVLALISTYLLAQSNLSLHTSLSYHHHQQEQQQHHYFWFYKHLLKYTSIIFWVVNSLYRDGILRGLKSSARALTCSVDLRGKCNQGCVPVPCEWSHCFL